nr:right-handed parallel beta-helix repeat-containing protein [bacterium]
MGTRERQIIVRGIPGPNGEKPIIDGDGAVKIGSGVNTTRGLVSIGGSNTSTSYVTVQGFEVRNAHPNYTTSDNIQYANNAIGVWFVSGSHVTIRNNEIHNNGNGLFSYVPTTDLLVEYNHIYDNGIAGSMYEHNSYCATIRTTYQYNDYGPLKTNAYGYGLKDRGSQTIIRYNTISGGRRQISLDDGEDSQNIVNDAGYNDSYVFGNLLIENNDGIMRLWGDDEIISFGGDSANTADRVGTLFFYDNTVISYRQAHVYGPDDAFAYNGYVPLGRVERTSIFSLPATKKGHTAQSIDCRNNIFLALGTNPAPISLFGLNGDLASGNGTYTFQNNVIHSSGGWNITLDLGAEDITTACGNGVISGISPTASGTNILSNPLLDTAYKPTAASPAKNAGGALSTVVATLLPVDHEPGGAVRTGITTIGAYQ